MPYTDGLMSPLLSLRSGSSRWATVLLAASMLLFQQIALAAYSCPIVSDSAEHSAMPDCEGMDMSKPDPAAPVLCQQDCQGTHATAPDARGYQGPAVALVPLYVIPPPMPPLPLRRVGHAGAPPSHADPPAIQRFCRLLI